MHRSSGGHTSSSDLHTTSQRADRAAIRFALRCGPIRRALADRIAAIRARVPAARIGGEMEGGGERTMGACRCTRQAQTQGRGRAVLTSLRCSLSLPVSSPTASMRCACPTSERLAAHAWFQLAPMACYGTTFACNWLSHSFRCSPGSALLVCCSFPIPFAFFSCPRPPLAPARGSCWTLRRRCFARMNEEDWR